MDTTWQSVEERVRAIASYLWSRPAVSETIEGVKCDCVVRIADDSWRVVEISKSNTISKLRTDLGKFAMVKQSLLLKGIYSQCFFVTEKKPTDSLRISGKGQNVIVMSIDEFEKGYFDYDSYKFIRSKKQFGSLIDISTGLPEASAYVNVKYRNTKSGASLTVTDIASLLKRGNKVILTGNFGAGKSRCVKELFDVLTNEDDESKFYTIAINLREHWGAKRCVEIIDRHLDDLGLARDVFKRSCFNTNIIYLLDGFDEIGTQSWSSDSKLMQSIRAASVVAVKDLIQNAQGGVLITGREHFFNSESEMKECFGLSDDDSIVICCNDEFSEVEIIDFVKRNNIVDSIKDIKLPQWLPMRPLVIQMALKETPELFGFDNGITDECDFWFTFLNGLCQREARINPHLNPDIIKNILIETAKKTRTKSGNFGPITMSELAHSFEIITGNRPNDESAIMLQRLPGLGRINADSPDRQFIDSYILNGLRSENIIQSVKLSQRNIMDEDWKNPINIEGVAILSCYINKEHGRQGSFLAFAKQATLKKNRIISGDILAALTLSVDESEIDYKELTIFSSHMSILSFEGKKVNNLTIDDSIIEQMDITNATFGKGFCISNCYINRIVGIPSEAGLPKNNFIDNGLGEFQSISTISRINSAKLSEAQKVLVIIIKKTFFQPGQGRKEEALLRGFGKPNVKRVTEKILNKLLEDNILSRHKGDTGWVYSPNRRLAGRMKEMLDKLTTSNDPIWVFVTSLKG